MQAVISRFHSALEKISTHRAAQTPAAASLEGLFGETVSFQISCEFGPDYFEDFYSVLSVECEGQPVSVFSVEEAPCTFPCGGQAEGAFLTKTPELIPDVLVPYEGKPVRMNSRISRVFWVDVEITARARDTEIIVLWKNRKGELQHRAVLPLRVIPEVLPPQSIHYTEWMHNDCLCHKYGCEMFSEEFFKIAEAYIRCGVKHGVNMLLTPVFTPSLDIEKGGRRMPAQLVGIRREGGRMEGQKEQYAFDFSLLKRWVELARECGVRYFEIAPFFTQWGAKFAAEIYEDTPEGKKTLFGWNTPALGEEYADFLKEFLPRLIIELKALGVKENTFFHISDEPSPEHLDNYRRAREMILPYIDGCPVMDALSSYAFYQEKLVSVPVVAEDYLEPFLESQDREGLWTYFCCCQEKFVPNIFLSMPSVRARILGVLLYKERIEGFLHWGYNFWNTQFSKEPVDPYRVTDAGLGFPSGDAFLVYPGEGGEPVPSLRLKVMRDVFQDIRVLAALEKKAGREEVLELIREYLGEISFTSYPVEEDVFLRFRQEVNRRLSSASASLP